MAVSVGGLLSFSLDSGSTVFLDSGIPGTPRAAYASPGVVPGKVGLRLRAKVQLEGPAFLDGVGGLRKFSDFPGNQHVGGYALPSSLEKEILAKVSATVNLLGF